MKKLLMALVGVVVMAGTSLAQFQIPNVEASMFYDMEASQLVSGVTSRLLSYKDIDIRVGYIENKRWIASLSYDLKNLEKLGTEVKYAWGDSNLTLGTWVGYDFDKQNMSYGFMTVLIQVGIK